MTSDEILALTLEQAKAFVKILEPETNTLRSAYQRDFNNQSRYDQYLRTYGQLFGMQLHAGVHDHELGNKNREFQDMQKVYDSRVAIVAARKDKK